MSHSNSNDLTLLPFIDALRGIAILGVILTHCGQWCHPDSATIRLICGAGARGVQLFFVMSAFTLYRSHVLRQEKSKYGIAKFFARRTFRVAPLFWMAIPFYLAVNGTAPNHNCPDGIGPRQILLTVTFLHGWFPDTVNSVVPGGWSIAAEMTFYLMAH